MQEYALVDQFRELHSSACMARNIENCFCRFFLFQNPSDLMNILLIPFWATFLLLFLFVLPCFVLVHFVPVHKMN